MAQPFCALVREPPQGAAPEPPGHGITRPGRGRGRRRVVGVWEVFRAYRRAPRPRAVIERSTGPPLARLLTAHAAIHSFISASLHLPTLLSIHVSDLSSAHPIIAPGITQTCQPWLPPLSPACQSCLSHSPCPPPPMLPTQAPLRSAKGRSAPTTSITLRFRCSVIAGLPLLTPHPAAANLSIHPTLHSCSNWVWGAFSPPCLALPEAWWLLRAWWQATHLSPLPPPGWASGRGEWGVEVEGVS